MSKNTKNVAKKNGKPEAAELTTEQIKKNVKEAKKKAGSVTPPPASNGKKKEKETTTPVATPKKKKKSQFKEGFEERAMLTHKRGEKETNVGKVPVSTTLSGRDTGAFGSVRIFGHPLTAVLRTMGRNGITAKECRAIMNGIGLEAVRDSSIATCIGHGRGGKEEVHYAPIGKKELAALKAAAKE
jgi:hypothetical protein